MLYIVFPNRADAEAHWQTAAAQGADDGRRARLSAGAVAGREHVGLGEARRQVDDGRSDERGLSVRDVIVEALTTSTTSTKHGDVPGRRCSPGSRSCTSSASGTPPEAVTRRLPAARLEQLRRVERSRSRCRPSPRRGPPRHAREHVGVHVVRRRLDDRPRPLRGVARLEDPRADEDAVGAELHAERRVGGRRDAAGGEGDDGSLPLLGDPLDELDRRAQLLRLGVELLAAQRARAGGSPPNTERMCVTALTMSPVPASPLVRIIAAPSAIRRSASPRFVAPQTNGHGEVPLVDVVLEVGRA